MTDDYADAKKRLVSHIMPAFEEWLEGEQERDTDTGDAVFASWVVMIAICVMMIRRFSKPGSVDEALQDFKTVTQTLVDQTNIELIPGSTKH